MAIKCHLSLTIYWFLFMKKLLTPHVRSLMISMLFSITCLIVFLIVLSAYVCRFTMTDKVDGTVLKVYGVTRYMEHPIGKEILHVHAVYVYDQKSYTLDTSISDKMAREMEQHINVYVNRRHPEKAYIYDPMPIYLYCIFIVLFLFCFISSAKTFIRAARNEYSEIKMRELVDKYNNKLPQ